MESATIIIFFARLVHFRGERGVVKKSTLCTLVILMMKKMDGPNIGKRAPLIREKGIVS
jgi:hypothetical protein